MLAEYYDFCQEPSSGIWAHQLTDKYSVSYISSSYIRYRDSILYLWSTLFQLYHVVNDPLDAPVYNHWQLLLHFSASDVMRVELLVLVDSRMCRLRGLWLIGCGWRLKDFEGCGQLISDSGERLCSASLWTQNTQTSFIHGTFPRAIWMPCCS